MSTRWAILFLLCTPACTQSDSTSTDFTAGVPGRPSSVPLSGNACVADCGGTQIITMSCPLEEVAYCACGEDPPGQFCDKPPDGVPPYSAAFIHCEATRSGQYVQCTGGEIATCACTDAGASCRCD